MSKILYTSLLMLLLVGGSVVAEEADGGYMAPYLDIPMGARPAAMGGAYVSLSNDGAGVFYNVAGITGIKRPLFASSYRAMELDRKLGYISVTIPTRGESALGLSWLYAGYGSVDARNSDGDLLGHEISQNDHNFSVMFAKRFEDWLSVGIRGSYLTTLFAEMTQYTVSIDAGFMVYVDQLFDRQTRELMAVRDIQAGLSVRNLTSLYRWNSEKYLYKYTSSGVGTEQKDEIPLEVALGGSARFLDRKLLLASDLVINEKQGLAYHGGAEYLLRREFALRAGISDGRLTAGTGYLFKFTGQTLAIDYAFSTDKVDEGSEHIFSFDLLF